MSELDKIIQAHEKMNELNARDPQTIETADGHKRPRELVMAERLERWVKKVVPQPSTALLLASRCQHLMRFAVPRSEYEPGRIGYLKWRKDLAKMHADRAEEILREVDFDEETIAAVRQINLKQGLKTNPDAQAMEDALCLSFLEHEYPEFSAKHPDDKVIDIVRKTWAKMSPRGQELALALPLEGRPGALVQQALS